MATPSDPYMEHLDGYLELVEDDSSLFQDISVMVTTLEQEPILPELLWFMGHHSKEGDRPENAVNGLPDFPNEPHAGSHTTDIERLLDTDSRQAEPPVSPTEQWDSKNDLEH